MNKKYIIVGIVSIVIIVSIAFLINYSMDYSSSPGDVTASREEFNPEIKYIPISNSFLDEYPVVKNLIDDLIRDERSFVDSQEFPEIQSLTNADARNLQNSLDELKPENPGYDIGYRVEYQEEYYRIGVTICFPQCGPYS